MSENTTKGKIMEKERFDEWFEAHFADWLRAMRGGFRHDEVTHFRANLLTAWNAALQVKMDEASAALSAARERIREMGAGVVPELTAEKLQDLMREWMMQPTEVRGPAWPGYYQYEHALKRGYSLAVGRDEERLPDTDPDSEREYVTWIVRFSVVHHWIEDGFDLDDDRALAMLANDLRYANIGSELSAQVIDRPNPKRILKIQGAKE